MSANKPAFEEYQLGDKYVLRFYRVDHGLVCTINESMVQELREVIEELNNQNKKENWLIKIQAEQQTLKQIIDMLILHHDTLACSSYPMIRKNNVHTTRTTD